MPRRNDEENLFKSYYIKSFSPKAICKNIKQFVRNCKYAYQRATKGYADCDVWGVDTYIGDVLADMLYTLSLRTDVVPIEFTADEWRKKLQEIANSVYYSNPTNREFPNKYEKQMEESRKKWTTEKQPDGSYLLKTNYTDEEERMRELWLEDEMLMVARAKENRKKVLEFIEKYWDYLGY